jgi:hypothetical protein
MIQECQQRMVLKGTPKAFCISWSKPPVAMTTTMSAAHPQSVALQFVNNVPCAAPLVKTDLLLLPDKSGLRAITVLDPDSTLLLNLRGPVPPWSLVRCIDYYTEKIRCIGHFTEKIRTANDTISILGQYAMDEMFRELNGSPIKNDLSSEFQTGRYSITGITMCRNFLTVARGCIASVASEGTLRQMRFTDFDDDGNSNIRLFFSTGMMRDLPYQQLPFTNKTGVWFETSMRPSFSLPLDWFPFEPSADAGLP